MFEPVGNFIFQLSERETIKIATALSIGPLFFKNFSDFYHPSLSKKCVDEPLPRAIAKLGISVQDGLSRLRLMSFARHYAIIWKQLPSSDLSAQLQKQGFRRVDVPRNPTHPLKSRRELGPIHKRDEAGACSTAVYCSHLGELPTWERLLRGTEV